MRSLMGAVGLAAWLGAPLNGQSAFKDSARNPQVPGETRATRHTSPMDRRVSLDLRNVTLRDALHEIDRQAHLGLAFTPVIVPLDRKVTCQADSITVAEALARVLHGTGVIAVVTTSETVMLVRAADVRSEAPAADTTRYAMVVVHVTDDTTQLPLVGAVVGVRGTQLQAKTTETGYALLHPVPSGPAVVYARFLGYTPAEQHIVVPDTGYVTVNVPMKMGMARLQEVVTTATGPQRRYELGNDVTILNADSLVATQPISNVTQILEGRVPGLTVQHTSGAPGDPSRLRLRGTSSVLRSNDPIVIVDGVRVYSAQSDSSSANIATGRSLLGGGAVQTSTPFAAPSPLDQIDPASIETIEVMKGPSAATLYGPDAANGVIVITTKKGKPGPGRWTLSAERGMSNMPGKYPLGDYRWGTDLFGNAVICPLIAFNCKADSLVLFQALNHPQYSILRGGTTTRGSLGVSGGSEALTYNISGSIDDESGMIGLPPVEVDYFRLAHDGANPFSWMRHPQHLSDWDATSRLTAKLSDQADASVSLSLTRETQQRSDLEQDLALLMTTFIDPKSRTYYQNGGGGVATAADLLPNFYHQVTDQGTNLQTGGSLGWRPLSWLSTTAGLGINFISREDDDFEPSNELLTDSAGGLSTGRLTELVTTLNLGASARVPLPWGIHLQLNGGANLIKTTTSALITGGTGLVPGTNSLVGAEQISFSTQTGSDQTSYGWYVEPDITWGHFAISPGIRLDQSSTFGKNARQPLFPKVGVSWLVSEEPFFPLKKIFDTFRARVAYGEAGVWPGPTDQLRLYQGSTPYLDGGFQPATQIYQLGNAQLRPERSTEIEGGFDADLFHDWISIGLTAYRKMRFDAIMSVPVAPSVYGTTSILENIGDVRNTGIEGTLSTQFLRTDLVAWSAAFNLTRNHNLVTRLGPGVVPFGTNDARVVAGYPLFSRWAKPILAYTDANHDGIIEPDEVLVGDSLVYLGTSEPDYEVGLATQVALFRAAITVSANFGYQAGLTQLNTTITTGGQLIFSPGAADPHAPFREQAAIAALGTTDYGLYQTVNDFRFSSLSVAYRVPAKIVHWLLRASSLSVALQGTNLALFTNYKGKDPNVNGYPTGNQVADFGTVPQPRIWQISVHASY
jgi:TonB-linked SusC/RagA family outer membrane protein